jgi:uncharacterized membrane protein (UPF0127 family)
MNKKEPFKISLTLSFIIVVLIVILPFAFKVKSPHANQSNKVIPASAFSHVLAIGTSTILVAIADTEALREQGLSKTSPLETNQGMLFIFDAPLKPSFWMKDMNYPLDIIWIDKDRKIVDVSENLDPKTYPQGFSSNTEILYALEVSSGFYKTNNLKIGDKVSF